MVSWFARRSQRWYILKQESRRKWLRLPNLCSPFDCFNSKSFRVSFSPSFSFWFPFPALDFLCLQNYKSCPCSSDSHGPVTVVFAVIEVEYLIFFSSLDLNWSNLLTLGYKLYCVLRASPFLVFLQFHSHSHPHQPPKDRWLPVCWIFWGGW